MKISARLLIFLIICTLSPQGVKAEDVNDLDTGQDSAVAIELTKFDLNDTTLELSYKIKNNTDHDVWICDSVDIGHSNSEIYLAEDAQTLIIRKRLDVSPEVVWASPPGGRYVRLQAAQEYSESLSYALPVHPVLAYITERAYAESAKRIVLEIGFYDQDLPGLIRSIIEVAERFGCANVELEDYESDIMRCYFKGLLIKGRFGGLEYFDEHHPDGSEQFITVYTDQLLGEQVLQISVDGLYIPYKGNYPPLENQDVNEPADSPDVKESAVSMELTHFEITDANLELAWKIKNNTDHDVWICDRADNDSSHFDFEVYMPEDDQFLLIRRRLDVPSILYFPICPIGRYVLLRSGQERNESLSLDVPIKPRRRFATGRATYDHARRLVLEIGFYNEDLPGMIRDVLEIAEKLNCTHLELDEYITPLFIRYFEGIWIAHQLFGGLSNFEEYVYQEGNEEITIPYTRQRFSGEQVLRLEIDGINILYDEVDWDLGI